MRSLDDSPPASPEGAALLWLGITHGVALKGLSIAAKLVFLVAVAPRLPAGELARYLLLVTSCLILSRVLLLGLDEQLTVEVRGDVELGRRYAAVSWPLLLLATASAGVYLVAGLEPALIVAGATALTGAACVASVARGLRTAAFELAINLPPVLFVIGLLVLGIRDALPILLVYVLTAVIVQVGVVVHLRLFQVPWRVPWRALLRSLRSAAWAGLGKMGSSLLLALQVRGLVLIPAYLAATLISDALALSLLLAEAALQVALVPVHRNYTRYAQGSGGRSSSGLWSAGHLIGLSLLGLGVAWLGPLLPITAPASVDYGMIGWALLLMGGVAAFCEARYFLWSRGVATQAVIVHQLVAVGLLAGIVLTTDAAAWLSWTALSYAAWVGIGLVAIRLLPDPDSAPETLP